MTTFSDLDVRYIGGRRWRLLAPLTWRRDKDAGFPELLRVPDGFVTDFASVPRIFWRLIPPTGDHGPACVLHDWLYSRKHYDGIDWRHDRRYADALFYEALGDGFPLRWLLWAAVRLGGWWAYRRK